MSQSSNDTFQTAMHIATVLELANHLIPNVESLINEIRGKAIKWVDVVKIGRTHLQDATPLTVGQEWSGYMAQLNDSVENIKQSMKNLYKLAAQAGLQLEQDSIACPILDPDRSRNCATNQPSIY